jgi:hypothetical protein
MSRSGCPASRVPLEVWLTAVLPQLSSLRDAGALFRTSRKFADVGRVVASWRIHLLKLSRDKPDGDVARGAGALTAVPVVVFWEMCALQVLDPLVQRLNANRIRLFSRSPVVPVALRGEVMDEQGRVVFRSLASKKVTQPCLEVTTMQFLRALRGSFARRRVRPHAQLFVEVAHEASGKDEALSSSEASGDEEHSAKFTSTKRRRSRTRRKSQRAPCVADKTSHRRIVEHELVPVQFVGQLRPGDTVVVRVLNCPSF